MTNPMPCPHCGAEPAVYYGRNSKECWAYVSCACGAMTKNFHATTDKAAKELAVETWNTREDRTCHNVPDEYWLEGDDECFTCSECGAWMYLESESLRTCSEGHVKYCYNCGARVVSKTENVSQSSEGVER